MTPAQIAATLSAIIPVLEPLVNEIETVSRSSPDTIAKVNLAMQGVKDGIAALGTAESTSASQPIVQRVEADAQAVLTVAAQLPLPGPAGTALRIAALLVPIVFTSVNMALAQHNA